MYRDEYPHGLSQKEAIARVQALTDYWDAQYNTCTEWNGHIGTISGKVLGLSFLARFTIDLGRLHGELKVSFIAVKMGGRKYLKRKLDHYMNPQVPLDDLRAVVEQLHPATA